jgi:TolB protein
MTEASAPVYADWKNRGADALAAGSIGASADGRQEARFRLYDVNKQSSLGGSAFVTSKCNVACCRPSYRRHHLREADRRARHLLDPRCLCGQGKAARYELHISDADGQNARWR